MKIGEVVKTEVEKLATGGDGMSRLGDSSQKYVVFTPYTAPKDKVEVRLTEVRKNFARALPVSIITPSPSRVEPACPYYFKINGPSKTCGGCNFQHLSYASQLEEKNKLLLETLTRIGGFDSIPLLEPIGINPAKVIPTAPAIGLGM